MVLKEKQSLIKSIQVKNISIYPNVYMSSMHGVTDYSFRRLIHQITQGKVGLTVSEFVSAKELCKNSRKALLQTKYDLDQKPFCLQIYGGEPEYIAQATRKAEVLGADLIELNSGCPSSRVVKNQCGSGLLLDLNHFKEILQTVVNNTSLPVSVKVRTGYFDEKINLLESHRIAQEEGASLFVIHGRTRQQGYKGLAKWDLIGNVKQKSEIPIVGNGDVLTLEHALEKLKTYGVDGVSIGRGMLFNPWLLRDVYRLQKNQTLGLVTPQDQLFLFKTYAKNLLEETQSEQFALGRLKQLGSRILKTYNPHISSIQAILKTLSLIDFFEALASFLEQKNSRELETVESLNSYHQQKIEYGSQY